MDLILDKCWKTLPDFKCIEAFLNESSKSFSLPDTIKPAATFKATACENSLDIPLNISIIFKEL